MRNTVSSEKQAQLAQYRSDVADWVAKHGPIPLVPVQRADIKVKSIRQRDAERFQRECAGVGV